VSTFVASVLVFGLLIFIHELGHFLLARRAGIPVKEFALGFGPVLVSARRRETVYSWRLFPLGGFVRMVGLGPEDQDDARGFNRQPVGRRFMVIAAGPAMNFILATVLFALVFAVYGMATAESTAIGEVLDGYPAAEAGLRPGDRVLAIDGTPVRQWTDLVVTVQQHQGVPLAFLIERQGREITLTVTPAEHPQRPGQGFIGLSPQVVVRRLDPLSALYRGVSHTGRIALLWAHSLGMLLRGQGTAEVAGPVGIIGMIGEQARQGLANLIWLAAVLSANLGFINLLPIPALDGSRLVFLAVEGVRGRPMDPEKENFIHLVGFALLILLILLVTYRDIQRLSAPGL